MGILKEANIPKAMEIRIVGESLFNDGIAVVVFISILQIINAGLDNMQPGHILLLFLREAGGGLLLGIVLGYFGFYTLLHYHIYSSSILMTCTGHLAAAFLMQLPNF